MSCDTKAIAKKSLGMTIAQTLAATVEDGKGKGGVKAGKWGAAARALAYGDLFILRSQVCANVFVCVRVCVGV